MVLVDLISVDDEPIRLFAKARQCTRASMRVLSELLRRIDTDDLHAAGLREAVKQHVQLLTRLRYLFAGGSHRRPVRNIAAGTMVRPAEEINRESP